jgi:hypothetical protein
MANAATAISVASPSVVNSHIQDPYSVIRDRGQPTPSAREPVFHIMASLAEFERTLISYRSKNLTAQSKKLAY